MSGKRAKKLRKFLDSATLPESQWLQHTGTKQIVRGPGKRKAYKVLKAVKGDVTLADLTRAGLKLTLKAAA